jgi:hypothetical protein
MRSGLPGRLSHETQERMKPVLASAVFWRWFVIASVFMGAVLAWEMNAFTPWLPGPIRPPITSEERVFTALIVLLIGFDAGLYGWRRRFGSCPAGVRRATGIGGMFGALALLCPACTLIPIALLGTSITLGFLTPFLPLLRLVAVIILAAVAAMLWPRERS